jgi:signal transduction histidine kinase
MVASQLRRQRQRRNALMLGLAVMTLLLIGLEHQLGLHEGTRAVRYFSLLPVLAGAALLPPVPLLVLGVFVLSAQQLEGQLHPLLDNPEADLRLMGRVLVIGACLWISSLRRGLQERNRELRVQLMNSLRASALAHEIRQPLTVILLTSRELLRNFEHQDSPDPACTAAAGMLHEASEQLDATIRSMASLLRSMKTEQRPVDLAAVLAGALVALEPQLRSSHTLLKSQGTDRPLQVIGDGEQLKIACGNLLRNALEAMESVEPSRRRLLVSLEHHSDLASLMVADSGPGLPCGLDELMNQTSSKPNGMGLGLWIVQTIAQHHGGVLEASRSRELGGAELRFSLPYRR